MRFRLIPILTLSASSLLVAPLFGQTPLLPGAQIGGSQAVPSNVVPGDTRFSESQEARSMSPPHWGSDKPYWPNKSPDQGPGCDTDGRPLTGQQASPASTGQTSRYSLPQTGMGQAAPGQLQPGTGTTGPGNATNSLHMFVPRPASGQPTLQPWPSRTASDGNMLPGEYSPRPTNRQRQSPQRYPLGPPASGAGWQSGGAQQEPDFLKLQDNTGRSVMENSRVDPLPWQLPQSQTSQAPPMTDGANPVSCDDWDRGFRQPSMTVRPQVWDDGGSFDFEEKKKQYPPMSEILATGRYFSMLEWQAMKPSFLDNSAISVASPTTGHSIAHDFDFEAAPRFRAGFESKYGPGIELQYAQYDHLSDQVGFTSDGVSNGTSSVWMAGPGRLTSLSTSAAGERIVAAHDLEVHSLQASFFKEVKLPISRVNGMFGVRYVSVAQGLNSRLFDSTGVETALLTSKTDLRVAGPTLGLEYYRPMGHTPFELVGAFNGAVLFGNRDQLVQNSSTLEYSNIGADEFLSIIDFYGGVQYVKQTAERRSWYIRLGISHQVWLGGGTSSNPESDFGFRGVGIAFGLNR